MKILNYQYYTPNIDNFFYMKKTLFAYSFAHFVVDFLCVFMIFSIPDYHPLEVENMLFYIVLY